MKLEFAALFRKNSTDCKTFYFVIVLTKGYFTILPNCRDPDPEDPDPQI